MSYIEIKVVDIHNDAVENIYIEALDMNRGWFATLGPSDQDGLIFASLPVGSYYIISRNTPVFLPSLLEPLVVDTDPIEIDYTVIRVAQQEIAVSDEYREMRATLNNIEAKLGVTALTTSQVKELEIYLRGLDKSIKEERMIVLERLDRYSRLLESFNDQTGFKYWRPPVSRVEDLPSNVLIGCVCYVKNTGTIYVYTESGWETLNYE